MLLVQKNARNLIMKEEEYNVNKTAKTKTNLNARYLHNCPQKPGKL